MAHLSPELIGKITYINGRKCLEYTLVTEDLIDVGVKSGHTEYLHPFISDHRGVYCDGDI